MKRYKVNETFYSIQGEGYYAGTPVTFIRLSGCNKKCSFCDTQHQTFEELALDEIYQRMKDNPSKIIVVTGGEPLLQLDKEFLKYFKKLGYRVHVETNGTLPIPEGIDWVTVSPKNTIFHKGNELKVVYEGQDMSKYDNKVAISGFRYFYIQPCSMGNIKECVEYVKQHPKWRLSLQTQKMINIQ